MYMCSYVCVCTLSTLGLGDRSMCLPWALRGGGLGCMYGWVSFKLMEWIGSVTLEINI